MEKIQITYSDFEELMDLKTKLKNLENGKQSIEQQIIKNGYVISQMKNQTEDMCLTAVKQNGLALQYVKNQTDKICLEAVKQNGLALQFSTSDGKTTFDSNSDDFTSVKGFTSAVLPKIQAKDIATNTFTVPKTDAQPGDMMILTAPHNHIAAYSDVNSPTDVTQRNLVYGNLSGGKPTNLIKTRDWSNSTSGGIKYAPDKKTAHRWKVLQPKQ